MKLYKDKNWKAVHFKDGRTILQEDWYLYNRLDWEELIYDTEVEQLNKSGHYKAKE